MLNLNPLLAPIAVELVRAVVDGRRAPSHSVPPMPVAIADAQRSPPVEVHVHVVVNKGG
ncbi:hypothetical protein [Azospirillum sp. TSO22-1]|uniref:hypothetical protein n=1 Tax=Azospirillum sp. TSO22-1 TaxID=716789 RepID=UPI001304A3F0|nr:hypothetical protein [Azospirillum sp. TSO22-1]